MVTTVTFDCDWCGEEATQRKAHYRGTEHHFCSPSCTNKWQARDTPELVCENCGEVYQVQPADKDESRFCSAECRNSHPYKGKTQLDCEYCGEDYEVYPSQAPRSSFCSAECQLDWMHDTYRGEDHPRHVSHTTGWYGPEWEDIRAEIHDRDGHSCVVCGAERDETPQLDVHHIVPYRKFESNEEAHSKDNLITLCRSCHSKYEGIPLDSDAIDADYSDFS